MTNRWTTLAVLLSTLWLSVAIAVAQAPPSPDDDGPPLPADNSGAPPKFNLLDALPGVLPGAEAGPKLFVTARFEIEAGTNRGRLHVTAQPAEGWHLYSITQRPGGPLRS